VTSLRDALSGTRKGHPYGNNGSVVGQGTPCPYMQNGCRRCKNLPLPRWKIKNTAEKSINKTYIYKNKTNIYINKTIICTNITFIYSF
jgi:hypothetical protein